MMSKLCWACLLVLILPFTATTLPKVVQSLVVEFPSNGRVIVQAKEAVGQFPLMLFTAEKTGQVLLQQSIKDKDKLLIPGTDGFNPPDLRFRVIRSTSFNSPLIMSVAVAYGGSDDAFYLTVFGEVEGKIKCLNEPPIFANNQGGYYLGYLNDKLGYGLATWNFIWGHDVGESHYESHRYAAEIYTLQDGKFKLALRRNSQKKYSGDGAASLREIGINVVDQRKGIPKIKDNLRRGD